jgi:hypothetical protein
MSHFFIPSFSLLLPYTNTQSHFFCTRSKAPSTKEFIKKTLMEEKFQPIFVVHSFDPKGCFFAKLCSGVGLEMDRIPQLEKRGIQYKLDSFKFDRRCCLEQVFPLVYDRTNIRAALAKLLLLGKFRVVNKESQWKNKVIVSLKQILILSKRIKANKVPPDKEIHKSPLPT